MVKTKKRNDKYRFSLKGRYATLKRNAVRNGFDINISLYEYALLIIYGCYYCGDELPISGHGVDRIDSSKGYIIDNVRPCCATCNMMKGVQSERGFYNKLRQILKHFKI